MADRLTTAGPVRLVFSDFDGTLTEGEDFSPLFLNILNLLKERRIPLVIVTGRSKSWAHFFLTHFPSLETVVSEGGGVISRKGADGAIEDRLMVSEQELERLESFALELQERFSHLNLTADSFGRQTDRALELSSMNSEIEDFAKERGINFSRSSVHFNFWCGQISKYRGVSFVLKHYYPFSERECIYFGDSLNDESMFQHFEKSVGVSNIVTCLDKLQHTPSIILKGQENRGASGVYSYLSKILK